MKNKNTVKNEENKTYTEIKSLVSDGKVIEAMDRLNKLRGTHRPSWFIAMAFKNKDEKIGLEVFKMIKPENITWKKNQALRWAVENNLVEAVKELAPYWSSTPNKWNFIFRIACRNGNKKIVKALKPYSQKPYKEEFEEACSTGHEKIVKLLIDYTDEKHLYTGFIYAVEFGKEKVVREICQYLETMEKTKEQIKQYDRCFSIACARGHLDVVKIMSESDIEIDNTNALFSALQKYESLLDTTFHSLRDSDKFKKKNSIDIEKQKEIIKIIASKIDDDLIEEKLKNINTWPMARYPNGTEILKSLYQNKLMRKEIDVDKQMIKRKRVF